MDWVRSVLEGDPAFGVLTSVETEWKYAGYLSQQKRQMERVKDHNDREIPRGFSFAIPGLSREVQSKLERVQPETLGQAARVPGVTPAAVAILDVYLTLQNA